MDGWCWYQRWRRLRGNRRFQLQRDRESRPHSRFECDDSGSARCQSRTIDFPAPGSRFPPDGCAWKRGSRHSGLRFASASAPRKSVWKDSLLPRGGNVCAWHHGSCQIPADCAQNSNEISPKKGAVLRPDLIGKPVSLAMSQQYALPGMAGHSVNAKLTDASWAKAFLCR